MSKGFVTVFPRSFSSVFSAHRELVNYRCGVSFLWLL